MRHSIALAIPTFAASLLLAGCGGGGSGDGSADGAGSTAAGSGEATGDTDTTGTTTGDGPDCIADPPPEAEHQVGLNPDGTYLTPGARRITPAGTQVVVPGFATDVAVHPMGNVAYVTTAGRYVRELVVLDVATATVVQTVDRDDAFYGLELSPDGSRLYASAGYDDLIEVYDAAVDGTLTKAGEIDVRRYPTGMAISDDGSRLYVSQYQGSALIEIDTATLSVLREISIGQEGWDVELVESRNEAYVSGLAGDGIAVVDLTAGSLATTIEATVSPAGLEAHPDGSTVWAALSGADRVVAIDTATRTITDEVDPGIETTPDGRTISGNSNVNALWFDEPTGRLYASRGTDNAVSVLDGATLDPLGAIPVGWYPSDMVLSPDRSTLIVADGKGGGAGPNVGDRETARAMKGSVTFVDLENLDLAGATTDVALNNAHPREVFPFTCDVEDFPIPTEEGIPSSQIEHVILLVKENKTMDCVFGDETREGMDVESEALRFGELITPNMHQLARDFVISDNFYTEVETSDAGHVYLTSGHNTEYVERTWIESYAPGGGNFTGYQLSGEAESELGGYLGHLLDNDIDITVYGEIVGLTSISKEKGIPITTKSDGGFPGGTFTNYEVTDEEKARYVAGRIATGQLKPFTFLLLPNDHGNGTAPGVPTLESMVADNDYGVGIVVDALSKSQYWDKSVVFILHDDPQGCSDHVDAHRSPLIVASPWVRRGHLSHVNVSFQSVFATIDRIFGIPHLARAGATASPLWDYFTANPDRSTWDAIPRTYPEEVNSEALPGGVRSSKMDFRSPDRNPGLYVIQDAYRLWRMGQITKEEAERRIDAYVPSAEEIEESREEAMAFDQAWEKWKEMTGTYPDGTK